MNKRLQEIAVSFLLCSLFPVLLFPIMSGFLQQRNPEVSQESTVGTEPVAESSYFDVCVEMKGGSVEKMPLEEYILAVVLREMPADFEKEALKAQAVVARTYTVRHMEKSGKHKNADMCVDSSCCQGFRSPQEFLRDGGSADNLAVVKAAVSDTKGQILVYDGTPIEATYFSCSGGTTEDAVAVWGSDVPYLRSTSSPGEEDAKYYIDSQQLSVAEIAKKLGIKLDDYREFVIGNITYTSGGGIDTALICGKEYKGTELRKKLCLRSTAFVISVAGDMVTITTKGYGHRVGMSQYGADAMAKRGSDYLQILQHYYHGVRMVSLNDLY